jgi:mercuric ion binding protein
MNKLKQLCIGIIVLLTSVSLANNVRITIDVEDMTCSLCVTSINHSLRKTDGVIKAKASLKTHSVEVIAPEELNTDILLEAIQKTGYKGKIAQVEPIE